MLEKMNAADFNEVFEIMKLSFPLDEYRPKNEQMKLLDNPLYNIYIVKEKENIIAFAAVWDFETFAFVEHFAVNPKHRNGGIGTKILTELFLKYNDMICLEVELPDNKTARRRINFYKRNGFFTNEFKYVQPPITKGRKEIPLLIMSRGRMLSNNEFENVRGTLFRYVYGISDRP